MSKIEWFKNVKIPTEPTPTSILVDNISPKASEAAILDFFNFCGEIKQFEIINWTDQQSGDESKKAYIEFQKEAAARTALLLTHALIVDRPVEISLFFENLPPYTPSADEVLPMVDSQPLIDEATIPQEDKPKHSVVEELLAKGYQLGDKIKQDAIQFDEQHGISVKFRQFLNQASAKGTELNEKYKIAQRSQEAFETASAKTKALFHNIDEKYHVQQKLDSFATATKNTATEINQKYHISEKVNQAANQVSALGQQAMRTDAGRAVTNFFDEVIQATRTRTDGVVISVPPAEGQATSSAEHENDAAVPAAEEKKEAPLASQ